MNQSDEFRFRAIDRTLLQPLVQQVLASTSVEILDWSYQQLHGAGGGVGGTAIYRFSGRVHELGKTIPWSLILKVLQSGIDQEPSSSHFWKREAEAYGSGWLSELSGGLVAPQCYGIDEHPDEVWIWLEDVSDDLEQEWSLESYGLAARHLGQFNGIYLIQQPMPTRPWLSSHWIRQDLATAAPGFDRLRQSLDHPMIQRSLPSYLSEKALRLWAEKEKYLGVLEACPHTVCHFDAFRQNLFHRSTVAGRNQTVAIDWAFVGLGPVGVEIAALVWVTLCFMEVEASHASELAEVVFENYLDGIRETGWRGDPQQVRFVFTASTALRRLGTLSYTLDLFIDDSLHRTFQQLMGYSVKEGADHFAEAGTFIEELADEARELSRVMS